MADSMMPSALEKTAHRLLSERLRAIGYEPIECLVFCRDVDDRKQLIKVATRSEGGKLRLTCMLGVRFEQIDLLLRPKDKNDSHSTVSCPIHLLRPEREYYEWEGGDEHALIIAVESMIAEIREVGFPFFERFESIEAVEEELSHSAVSDCLILSPHQRTGTLAAIALSRGDRSAAKNFFESALKDPRNQNPGKKRLLQELRTQLRLE